MSYDLTLKSDNCFSGRVQQRDLEAYFMGTGVLTPSGPDHFVFGHRTGGLYAEVDVELVSGDGDALNVDGLAERNCIRIHIPAAFSDPIDPRLFDVCRQIAGHLGWRLYDEQEGVYLD